MTIMHLETTPSAAVSTHLVKVGARRWRVVDRAGRIIGHLDDLSGDGEPRYRASRYRRASASLVPVGEFRRPGDAIDALRYAG